MSNICLFSTSKYRQFEYKSLPLNIVTDQWVACLVFAECLSAKICCICSSVNVAKRPCVSTASSALLFFSVRTSISMSKQGMSSSIFVFTSHHCFIESRKTFLGQKNFARHCFADAIVWCTAIRALLEYSARFSTNQSARYIVTML